MENFRNSVPIKTMNHVCRSYLFVPADRPDRVLKAARSSADAVILELEDGVPPENKARAREAAGQLLGETDFGSRSVALRVNRITTLYGIADMQAISTWPRKPDLLVLPKVESAGEIQIYDALLSEMETDCGLMVLIESSRGLLNAPTIVAASPRISCLAPGFADLSADMGLRPTWPVLYGYRSSLAAACALAGVAPVDPPCLDLRDTDALALECENVRDMGYTGKLCIHPSQLAIVNSAFSPSPEAIRWAQQVVRASETKGVGAIVVEGRMVDRPVILAAKRIVQTATRFASKAETP